MKPCALWTTRKRARRRVLWRGTRQSKKLMVSFRGTSEPRDVVTDASALMTPWARETDVERDDYDDSVPLAAGDPSVHAGLPRGFGFHRHAPEAARFEGLRR